VGFLTEIVERTRKEFLEHLPDEGHLWMRTRVLPPARDLEAALRTPGISILAEIERASPSVGEISDRDPGDQAAAYERGGAAAISVATEPRHFGGSLLDLRAARRRTTLPIMRKDFIVHPAQVLQARAEGADAVLLIAAALSGAELEALLATATDVGVQALVEASGKEDLDRAVQSGAAMLGLNARDLETLDVDLERALRLARRIPEGRVVVVESGVSTRSDVERAAAAGAHAVLVGEALMRSPDPARTLRRLRGTLAAVTGLPDADGR
jgi:indole-3-glycerol phosphate synthase